MSPLELSLKVPGRLGVISPAILDFSSAGTVGGPHLGRVDVICLFVVLVLLRHGDELIVRGM